MKLTDTDPSTAALADRTLDAKASGFEVIDL